MASRGFLIRFIDIGLIVLFGFLMISEIEMSSRVELAGSGGDDPEAPAEPTETIYVSVAIAADGSFAVSERVLGPAPGVDEEGLDEEGAVDEEAVDDPDASLPQTEAQRAESGVTLVRGVAALTEVLRARAMRYAGEGLEAIVLIEPSPASAVQHTVDVMDVCDRLGLAKSLRMDIEVEVPGA